MDEQAIVQAIKVGAFEIVESIKALDATLQRIFAIEARVLAAVADLESTVRLHSPDKAELAAALAEYERHKPKGGPRPRAKTKKASSPARRHR